MKSGLLDLTHPALGAFLGQERASELVYENGYLRLNRAMADDEPARKLLKWSAGDPADRGWEAQVDRLERTWEVGQRAFSLAVRLGQKQQQTEVVEPFLGRLTKMTVLLRLATRALVWLAPGTPALVEEVAAVSGRRRRDASALHPGAPVRRGQRRGTASVGQWIKRLMEVRDAEEEKARRQQLRGGDCPGHGGQEEGNQGRATVLAGSDEGRNQEARLVRMGHQGRGHASRRRARGKRSTPLEPIGGPGREKRR